MDSETARALAIREVEIIRLQISVLELRSELIVLRALLLLRLPDIPHAVSLADVETLRDRSLAGQSEYSKLRAKLAALESALLDPGGSSKPS